MARRINKIFGPPGTGKTTRLLQIVEEALSTGIRPERIAFLAFTKKAAQEAIDRAMTRFNFSADRLPWFRTIHSMAFRDVSASRSDIMQEHHYQEMGQIQGFKFTRIDEEMFIPIGTALGDRLQRIEHLSRLRKVDITQQWVESKFPAVPLPAVLEWVEALNKYKKANGLLDYTDLLEQFNSELDVDIVIIDEAQDLSLLQWDVIKKAAAKAQEIYIAGDDDQCIYGWAGAEVSHFLRVKAETQVLPVSFRLPRKVQRLALSVLDNIRVRQPKDWDSRAEDGKVSWVGNEHLLDLSQGTWMLLSRNHRFLSRYERMLKLTGYPYSKEGKHSTNTSETKAIIAWESWRKGNSITSTDLNILKGVIPMLENWHPYGETFLRDAPLPAPFKERSWMDALQIDITHREYIRACLRNREKLLDEPRITVSTIHKVKGGEADNVALITDITARPWQQLKDDEEQRVLYVGMTRARKTLSILRPQTEMSYRL